MVAWRWSLFFFFSSRRRHTRLQGDWSSDVCSSDLVYFGYGTNKDGILQIVDRAKLLSGPREPTPENLLAPQIGRFNLSSMNGAHTTLPVIGIEMAEFAKDKGGNRRDFVVVVNESLVNECLEPRQMAFIVDVTDEKVPVGVRHSFTSDSFTTTTRSE